MVKHILRQETQKGVSRIDKLRNANEVMIPFCGSKEKNTTRCYDQLFTESEKNDQLRKR